MPSKNLGLVQAGPSKHSGVTIIPPQPDPVVAETEVEPSLATLVSCMSIGIRAQAFVRGMWINSLQVAAAMQSGANPDAGGGKPARNPQSIKVTVALETNVPLFEVESLVTFVAKWSLAPALGNFTGRIEIVLAD